MAMSKEAKEAQAKYMREWRKKNKEKLKQYSENYWKNRAKADDADGRGVE